MIDPKEIIKKIRKKGYVTLKDISMMWDNMPVGEIYFKTFQELTPPKGYFEYGIEGLKRNRKIIHTFTTPEQLSRDPLSVLTEKKIKLLSQETGIDIVDVRHCVSNLKSIIRSFGFNNIP